MNYKQLSDFPKSVGALWRMGGQYQKAAEAVNGVIGRISLNDDNPLIGLKLTNHGENRIQKCVKYDLPGFARLITIQDSGVTLFCYAGNHADCDKWLERNRGRGLAKGQGSMVEVFDSVSVIDDKQRITGNAVPTSGALFSKLSEQLFDSLVLGLSRQLVRKIESLEPIHSEKDVFAVAECISDPKQSVAIYDVFALLRTDKVEEAVKRIKLYTGEFEKIESLSPEEIAALADSDKIRTIPANDPRFQQVFEHFVKSASYMDWMLFLHPEQADKVDRDFDGPAKLVGVSGSGKTCVVVKRAIRLADKYPDTKALILTLNRPLARLISDLVDAAALPEIRSRIDVLPFFDLCRQMLHEYEPHNDKLYDDKTWKSLEHIDEIWREFYRCELNNKDAAILLPIHDSLISRGVNAEAYVREEFDWIRSAVPPGDREAYLELRRNGRAVGFEKHHRDLLLKGLNSWETKMKQIGVSDYLGLSNAVCRYIDRLKPKYRCILVDESQDFGTTELNTINKLVEDTPNNLFFCGDAAQQVSAKHQSFLQAGVVIPGARSSAIRKNYRNSREILAAAYTILAENITEELLESEDFELQDPEYANFSGATPLLLSAPTLKEEIAYALAYLKSEVGDGGKKACLAFCGYSSHELSVFSKKNGIPLLDGMTTIEKDNVYLSDLEQTKGFEFDIVCIIGCSQNVLPDPAKPPREQFRDLSRFYVAMTRAKNQLVLSFSGTQSSLLSKADSHFLSATWSEYWPAPPDTSSEVPARLDEIRRHEDDKEKAPSKMTGAEFLYTEHALGLDAVLVAKIRELISGQPRLLEGRPIAWKNMGAAAADMRQFSGARQAFGPQTSQVFLGLANRIGLDL